VTEKLAVEGKYVKAGEPIYRVADLSTVWLVLQLYPEDASRIRFGQRVEAEMQSLPGEVFNGRVAFIDPTVDPTKRTVGVRVEFLNDDHQLRPGDYARATIYLPIGQKGDVYDEGLAGRWISPMHPQIIRDAPGQCPICGMDLVRTSRYGYSDVPVEQPASLYVPRSALLMAGDSSVVYVETEPGRFEIRPVILGPILRDRVIILSGLEEGEQVAVAGNFLIDSQMQLAGNPSLIDPARALTTKKERKSPLDFEHVHVESVGGEAGEKLEQLYAAYFAVWKSLTADKQPNEKDVTQLHELATALAETIEIPESARKLLDIIAAKSEHLHHMEIEQGRLESFRPISHAIVTLSTLVRGSEASRPYSHMFCPMVKGGGGDWLQASSKLINPYWGSQMLHCGRVAHVFPVSGQTAVEADDRPRENGK
jgi:Cu(I)/Ag(I) efflux system membrane fusion protein